MLPQRVVSSNIINEKNNNIISNRFNFLGNVNLPLQFQGDLCLQLTFILMDPALLLVVKVNII